MATHEQLEERLRQPRPKKKPRMKVHGKRVQTLQRMLAKKSAKRNANR